MPSTTFALLLFAVLILAGATVALFATSPALAGSGLAALALVAMLVRLWLFRAGKRHEGK